MKLDKKSSLSNIDKRPKSYFQQRLDELNITEELNTIKTHFFDSPALSKVQIFSEDKSGNIKIRYFDLEGDIVYYDKKGKLVEFYRTRLKEPKENIKYLQAENSGNFPFITPIVIEKYKKEVEINTLFI